MSQDWRTEVTAPDYFGNQKKQQNIDNRRPVVRTAADLVGPGIGSSAVRITDYNDLLATFNGYYSSAAGALSAPNVTDAFVGHVVMDDQLGGRQVFTSMATGAQYTRLFVRNPSDVSSISFQAWVTPEPVFATLVSGNYDSTPLPASQSVDLLPPDIGLLGDKSTYAKTTNGIAVLRPGIYTGYLQWSLSEYVSVDSVIVSFPYADGQNSDSVITVDGGTGLLMPLHFHTTVDTGFVKVTILQSTSNTVQGWWRRIHLTRLGPVS